MPFSVPSWGVLGATTGTSCRATLSTSTGWTSAREWLAADRMLQWIGPGTVVGKEGKSSYWIARGGRCILCAAEHLRPAESEELGYLFQARTLHKDLHALLDNLEVDPDGVFADEEEVDESMSRPRAAAADRPDRAMARRPVKRVRMRQKGPPEYEDGGMGEEGPEVREAFYTGRVPKALIKQLDGDPLGEDPGERAPPLRGGRGQAME